MSIPANILGGRVLCHTEFDVWHHDASGHKELPFGLIICAMEPGSYFLVACNDGWIPNTESLHNSVEEAKDSASGQFEEIEINWENINSPEEQELGSHPRYRDKKSGFRWREAKVWYLVLASITVLLQTGIFLTQELDAAIQSLVWVLVSTLIAFKPHYNPIFMSRLSYEGLVSGEVVSFLGWLSLIAWIGKATFTLA